MVCETAEMETVTPAAFPVAVPKSKRETVFQDEEADDGAETLDCARTGLLSKDGPS